MLSAPLQSFQHQRQQRPDWWRSAVIYEVYLRSFKDSDRDGIGDLRGVIEKLDYIATLHVDAIWITPFFPSPMLDFGYDICDYCAVDPLFGTLEDFQELLSQAHQRNLGILIDQVWNHTSDRHPWFQESRQNRTNPKADWYLWANAKADGSPPNNWRSPFGGSAWTWEAARQQYYHHGFLAEQPDLNWFNPAVVEAILEAARFWLELGVDGFRLDVVNFYAHDPQLRDNPPRPVNTRLPPEAAPGDPFYDYINCYNLSRPETLELLSPIRQLCDRYPGTVTLAEVACDENPIVTSSEYVRGDRRLHLAYNASLMREEPLSCQRLRQLIQEVEAHFQEGTICWTAGTHDSPRLTSRWHQFIEGGQGSERAFSSLFAALLLSLRGSCCLYQGDELGLTQADIPHDEMQDPFGIAGYPTVLGRDGCRTPIPWQDDAPNAGFSEGETTWLPLPPEHYSFAVNRQEGDPSSLLNHYRRLLHWRKQQPALLHGQLTLLATPEPTLGWQRHCDEQKLIALFNLSPQPHCLDFSPFADYQPALDLGFNHDRQGDALKLPGYGAFFATKSP